MSDFEQPANEETQGQTEEVVKKNVSGRRTTFSLEKRLILSGILNWKRKNITARELADMLGVVRANPSAIICSFIKEKHIEYRYCKQVSPEKGYCYKVMLINAESLKEYIRQSYIKMYFVITEEEMQLIRDTNPEVFARILMNFDKYEEKYNEIKYNSLYEARSKYVKLVKILNAEGYVIKDLINKYKGHKFDKQDLEEENSEEIRALKGIKIDRTRTKRMDN